MKDLPKVDQEAIQMQMRTLADIIIDIYLDKPRREAILAAIAAESITNDRPSEPR